MPYDTDLSFRISTESLNAVTARLRSLGGLSRYPEAYPVMVLERSRRERRASPREIRLVRVVFEALPADVQQLLMAGTDQRSVGPP